MAEGAKASFAIFGSSLLSASRIKRINGFRGLMDDAENGMPVG